MDGGVGVAAVCVCDAPEGGAGDGGCVCSADTEAADASSLTRFPRRSAHPSWDSADAPDLQLLASLMINSA